MIRFALNLKYLSSTFLSLAITVNFAGYYTTIDSGVSIQMIERLKRDINFEKCSPAQKSVGIMMDEMKIKGGLVFSRKLGKLVGWVQ